jgi:hypothetical protein
MKKKRFFFHYNKPESQRRGKPQISVHINKQCIITDNIEVLVPTEGKVNKRQPYFVMQGWANEINQSQDRVIIS